MKKYNDDKSDTPKIYSFMSPILLLNIFLRIHVNRRRVLENNLKTYVVEKFEKNIPNQYTLEGLIDLEI